jgi:DNA-binding NtrC family response regulator
MIKQGSIMKKILIIDNDWLLLDDLERILKDASYSISTVKTGLDGIKRLNREDFDMVITDLLTGDFDGNDVARHVRLFKKKSVTLMVGISEKAHFFKKHEFDRIIEDPVSTGDLVEIVKKCINSAVGFPMKKNAGQAFSFFPELECPQKELPYPFTGSPVEQVIKAAWT